jgi:hypothetical protein
VLQFDLNGRHYVVLVEDDFLSMIEDHNDWHWLRIAIYP